jgi:hypothetical protein
MDLPPRRCPGHFLSLSRTPQLSEWLLAFSEAQAGRHAADGGLCVGDNGVPMARASP